MAMLVGQRLARGALVRGCRAAASAATSSWSSGGGGTTSSWPEPDIGSSHVRNVRLNDYLYRDLHSDREENRVSKESRPQEAIGLEQKRLLVKLRYCARDHDWEQAVSILDAIPPEEAKESHWMPVYRGVLHVCCRAARYTEAKRVWELLPRRDTMAYNMLLGLCGRLHRIEEVESLLAEMEAAGVEKTGVTHGTVMHCYSHAHLWEQALGFLREADSQPKMAEGLNYELAYTVVMSACARKGQRELTQALLEEAKQKLGRCTNNHYNALMVSCGTDQDEALRIFAELREAGLKPRIADWRVLLSCHRRDFKDGIRLYGELRQELELGPVDFQEIWAVLVRNAVVLRDDEGLRWVTQEMHAQGVDPNSNNLAPSLQRILSSAQVRDLLYRQGSGAAPSRGARRSAPARHAAQPQPTVQPTAQPTAQSGMAVGPLPAGWRSTTDPTSGAEYFWRADDPSGTTTWLRPTS